MPTLTRKKPTHAATAENQPKKGDTGGQFYPQLNGLRFVFIFMVLVHHWAPQTLMEKYRIGWVGVDLFYVLSGFLIGEILLREREKTANAGRSIRNFIIRRALRIFPLYYTVVLLYSFLVDDGGILIWNLTYTNNIYQAIHLDQVKEEWWHLWSLCVEEQFYLFFPFLVFFAGRRTLPIILLSGILFSIVGRFVTVGWPAIQDTHILMPFCLDSLFLGVMLAYLKLYRSGLLIRILKGQAFALSVAVLCFVAIVGLCYVNDMRFVFGLLRVFGSIAGFYLIGYSIMKGHRGVLKAFLENKTIALLGKISYGIYLLHPFIERLYYKYAESNAVRNFFIGLNKPVISNRYVIDFVFLFLTTVFISYLSFRFFEKRFLKIKLLFS